MGRENVSCINGKEVSCMEMALVRMDEKGRIVIPKRMRKDKGRNFFIYTFESLIFLREVDNNKAQVIKELKRVEEAGK